MTIHQSDFAKGKSSQPYPSFAGHVCSVRATFNVPAAAGVVLNDIVELIALPNNCELVDVIFDTDDLDSNGAPTAVWDIGIMSGPYGSDDPARTCGDELFDGITTSQAGGIARTTDKRALRLGKSGSDRSIGAKLVGARATPQAGVIGLTVFYVAS